MNSPTPNNNRNNKLSSLVWEFNFRPDHYTHDSWLEQMPDGPLIKKLVGKHRSAERIVQHLLVRFGLENQMYFSFSNSLSRIALWSGADLEKLILHTGAVFYYSKVCRVVTREELQVIQEKMGNDLFTFMQRRAVLIKGKMAFGLKLPNKMDTQTALIVAGLLCLLTALYDYPVALRKRLMLKLPYDWYLMLQRVAPLGQALRGQDKECAALIQKVAIEIRMGVGTDGQIRFN